MNRFSNSKQWQKNVGFAEVSVRFFKIIFCPTCWFILKQLDHLTLKIYLIHLNVEFENTQPLMTNLSKIVFKRFNLALFLYFRS